MRIITNKQWYEYQNLRIQGNFNSVRDIKYLKDDIDLPIRSIVAMLALLGCEPIFSCCGFDYDGQPIHKSHEYGCVYFIMKENEFNRDLINKLSEMKLVIGLKKDSEDRWTYWNNKALFLRSAFTLKHKEMKYPWVSSRDCIHYSEIANFRIAELEKALWLFKDKFLSEVILIDTNKRYKHLFHSWQYPSLEPWMITIEDVII